MPSEDRLDVRAAQTAVLGFTLILIFFGLVRGSIIMFEGAERWQEGSHAVALLLPGAPASWGVFLFAFGIGALISMRRGAYGLLATMLLLMASWCIFFSVAFVVSAARNDAAALGGIWTYAFFALLYLVAAVTMRESYKRAHPKKRG